MSEQLTSVEEATSRILAAFEPLETEETSLLRAHGRALADALTAQRAQPPADVSAMDGYAVIAADLATAPHELAVVGTVSAGGDPSFTLTRGSVARIFTGALLPQGADAVIAQEDTEPLPNSRVRINETATPGKHVRRTGSDFPAGATLLAAGRLLDGRDIGLAAAANASTILVRRRPRIAILATGNELVALGGTLQRHQIIASTVPALASVLTAWGAEAIDPGIAPDDENAIASAIDRGREADLLVTLGGASVGDHDLVQQALKRLGFELGFWRIAMKPGKPLIFGRLGRTPIIGLPGNPVASLICALVFIRPVIRRLLDLRTPDGSPDIELPSIAAELAAPIPANGQRLDFLRGICEWRPGAAPLARVLDRQDSNQLSILSAAQCLIPRTPFSEAAKAASLHPIIPLAGLF